MEDGRPRAFDLAPLRDALAAAKRHRDFVGLIDKAQRLQSCAGDLHVAADYLEALHALIGSPRRGAVPDHKEAAKSALLAMTAILYARATHDGNEPGGRGSIQIAAKLTADQRADHDVIVRVRRRALAHVHAGEHLDDDLWHSGLTLLFRLPSGMKVVAAGNRITFNGRLLDRLDRQVPVARALLMTKLLEALDDVSAKIGPILLDPAYAKIAHHQLVDLISIYGSAAAVENAFSEAERGAAHTRRMSSKPHRPA